MNSITEDAGSDFIIRIKEAYDAGNSRSLRMSEISDLVEGWDGYGAPPISKTVIRNADALHWSLTMAGKTVRATPMSNGRVMLEWRDTGLDFTLEVGETVISGIVDVR